MKSSLISSIIVLAFGTSLSSTGLVQPAAIVVLVANGSDITINLPGEFSHNRLLNVVSNSGNNNPSVFDWIGGNGANKAPRLSIGGGNQASNGADGRGGVADIGALWKLESSTVPGAGRDDQYVDSGESEEVKNVTDIRGTSPAEMSTTRSLTVTASGDTRTTLNTWRRKFVTEAMNHPD